MKAKNAGYNVFTQSLPVLGLPYKMAGSRLQAALCFRMQPLKSPGVTGAILDWSKQTQTHPDGRGDDRGEGMTELHGFYHVGLETASPPCLENTMKMINRIQ